VQIYCTRLDGGAIFQCVSRFWRVFFKLQQIVKVNNTASVGWPRRPNTAIVGINEGIISTEIAPFGGMKDSGIGDRYGWRSTARALRFAGILILRAILAQTLGMSAFAPSADVRSARGSTCRHPGQAPPDLI
jgi:hypothetical protein